MLIPTGLRLLLLIAFFLLVTAWVLDGSSFFQNCVQESATKYDSTALNVISIHRDCFVSFVKHYRDEILATFTIILAVSTILLWFATRDLVREAQETGRRQLRAYVGIRQSDFIRIAAGEKSEFQIVVKNFGQTPAYDLETWTDIQVDTEERNLVWRFRTVEQGSNWRFRWYNSGKKVLDPGADYSILSADENVLEQSAFEEIKSKRKKIFVFGKIRYRDSFRRKHITTFSFYNRPELVAGKGLVICKKGNSAT